jgi:hypothetical protein
MNTQESFEAWLDETIGPLPAGEGEAVSSPAPLRPAFTIEDDGAASWALRKLARLETDMAERHAFVLKEQAKLEEWRTEQDTRARRERLFFEGLLHAYLVRLRDAGTLGRQKSYKLPHGTLAFRSVAADFDVTDEVAFRDWCGDQGLIETVIRPQWGEAKKLFVVVEDRVGAAVVVDWVDERTGEMRREVVPGVVVNRVAGESFSVKVAERKVGAAC